MKIKLNRSVIKRVIIMVFVIVLIITLPTIKLASDDNMELIFRSFVGKKSDYQGFIEIWNIDTFESGKMTKSDFLQSVAKEFQKENKGTYVIVRNVTENECKNMIASGQRPDLVSCSYGVAAEIKQYVSSFLVKADNVYENFLNAGKFNGEQYAIPWCFGNYYLLSTKSRVQEYFDENEDIKLSKIALSTGKEKVGKKKTEIIHSLGFGSKKYLLPKTAFCTYTKAEIVSANYAVNKTSAIASTPYSAYTEFLTHKFNILLGTQSELNKLKNRESLGKLEKLLFERVDGFTDLLQFIFMLSNSKERFDYSKKFIEFLISEKIQKGVLKTGLLPINKKVVLGDKEGVMSNIIPEKIESYECFNVFLNKAEIENLQAIQ